MKKISVKNTYNCRLAGLPSEYLDRFSDSTHYGVNPSRIPGIKPKLTVQKGDTVSVGSPLFLDKSNPVDTYVSPVAGTVSDIVFGPRRKIEAICIAPASQQEVVTHECPQDIQAATPAQLRELIQKAGLWSCFTAYPFNRVPREADEAPAIYVCIDNDEPHMPQSTVVLEGNEGAFLAGLKVLKQLAPQVYVGKSDNTAHLDARVLEEVTHTLVGQYPANNPGVFLYYNKETAHENSSWGIRLAQVIRLGQFFQTGQYPNRRRIVLAGSRVETPRHIEVQEGSPLSALLAGEKVEGARIICGGVFTGTRVKPDAFLGILDDAVHVLPEGKEQEMLSFFRLGADKPTFGNTYLSTLFTHAQWDMTTTLSGGYRSCISCGECPKVCPVGIYPQLLMKNLADNDIEEAMNQGVLDCVDCGLCTYVCPSKIELADLFFKGKETIAKEVG